MAVDTAFLVIGAALILVGVLLAFLGRKLWSRFMSLIGAILGGSVGYFVGVYYAPANFLVPVILAAIGSLLGSILFSYLVKIALALIAAAIPAYVTYAVMGGNPVTDQSAQDTRVIVAILVLLVVFSITYYFVEELIGVITALVGGFLLGAGIFLVSANVPGAIAGAAIVFVVGGILQTLAIRQAKKGVAWRWRRARTAGARRSSRRSRRAPSAPDAPPPPHASAEPLDLPPPPPP